MTEIFHQCFRLFKYKMKLLIDTPLIFVSYPIGSGGWFLSSLLYSAYNSLTIKHNTQGSGHSNKDITFLNNWYTYMVTNEIAQDILYQKNYDTLSYNDRVRYVANNFKSAPGVDPANVQVVSIHCQDTNILLDAFPKSKAIIIEITEDNIQKCVFNFIYKVLALNPIYFKKVCEDYGKDYDVLTKYLGYVNLESLEKLSWVSDLINMTNHKVDIKDEFEDRVFRISYDDYMNNADPSDLILAFNEFLQTNWSSHTLDHLQTELVMYRLSQPPLPTN